MPCGVLAVTIPILFFLISETKWKKCANSYNRNRSISKLEKNNITREELKEMIRTESFLSIGKRFEVSDNAIRKWCVIIFQKQKKKF
jgi:hypothetical protein